MVFIRLVRLHFYPELVCVTFFKNKDYAGCRFEEHVKDHLSRHPCSTVTN